MLSPARVETASRILISSAVSLFFLLQVQTLCAQTQVTRWELGAAGSLIPKNRFGTATDAGLGGRITFNFSRTFALDSEISIGVNRPGIIENQFGGRSLLAVSGIKAGVRRTRWGLFGKVRPGWISFSAAGGQQIKRRSHFAADLGGVFEIYPTGRTVLRFDAGTLLVRYDDRVLVSNPPLQLIASGGIEAPAFVSFGLSYRIGSPLQDQEASAGSEPSKFELGTHYSLLSLPRDANKVQDESGMGGRLTWNLNRHVSIESVFTYFPRKHATVNFQEGGRILQGLFGVKFGIRREKAGVFVKFRPGFQSYSLTLDDYRKAFVGSRFTNPAFDVGGGVEFYTSRSTLLRVDVGDVMVHFRRRTVIFPDGTPRSIPSFSTHSIQVLTGFAFRF